MMYTVISFVRHTIIMLVFWIVVLQIKIASTVVGWIVVSNRTSIRYFRRLLFFLRNGMLSYSAKCCTSTVFWQAELLALIYTRLYIYIYKRIYKNYLHPTAHIVCVQVYENCALEVFSVSLELCLTGKGVLLGMQAEGTIMTFVTTNFATCASDPFNWPRKGKRCCG